MSVSRSRREEDRRWTEFESEVLPHVDRLFRLALWFERDRDEAEDLVQDTLKEALERSIGFNAARTVERG